MASFIPLPGSSQTIVDVPGSTGPVQYLGFNVAETGGVAAHIRFREGGASGRIVESVKLPIGGSAGDVYTYPITVHGDLYYELVAGTVEGSVRIM